ncbi:MAG TPA: ATP-binding protein [Acidobacteriaceae bacterium]|nr:ATP-binding protein [Acidobacteriaceae bacterium]
MPRLIPRTIIGQLIAGTVVMQAILLGLFLSLTVRHELEDENTRSTQRLESQTMLLAHLVRNSLVERDAEQTQSLVEAVRASPVINSARITDLDGNTLALSPADAGPLDDHEAAQLKPPFTYHSFLGQNGELEGVAPVLADGRPTALAWIEPDPVTLHRNPRSLIQNALEYALLALLVNVLLAVILARTISRPLSILVAGTKELASDPEHSQKFPLPITTFNEAGELTESFNATVMELRRQRAGLRETLAMLDSMLATAPIGFAFYDRDLRYVRVNQYLAEIHGIPVEQHIGRHLREVVATGLQAQIEAGIQQVFTTGQPFYEMELQGETIDRPGEQRSWIMSFYPVHTEEQEVRWVGKVAIETTQRRLSEDALRKTEKLAAAGRLAASIAHEINNPLEAVTNLLYLLHNHPSLDTEARQYSEMAQSELSRVSQITQQTLRFYRQSTQPTPCNLAEILDSVLLLHNARIHGANVVVLREYMPVVDLRCFGGELRQLFANLIGNAIEAIPRGGGRLRLRVRPEQAWFGEQRVAGVRVTIADTGSGMTAEVRRRIFEPFFTTKEATGTGLGLWVSEEIVMKHAGALHVRSRTEAPSGTVFSIFFPYDGIA